jgi:hypothetical protein
MGINHCTNFFWGKNKKFEARFFVQTRPSGRLWNSSGFPGANVIKLLLLVSEKSQIS